MQPPLKSDNERPFQVLFYPPPRDAIAHLANRCLFGLRSCQFLIVLFKIDYIIDHLQLCFWDAKLNAISV